MSDRRDEEKTSKFSFSLVLGVPTAHVQIYHVVATYYFTFKSLFSRSRIIYGKLELARFLNSNGQQQNTKGTHIIEMQRNSFKNLRVRLKEELNS